MDLLFGEPGSMARAEFAERVEPVALVEHGEPLEFVVPCAGPRVASSAARSRRWPRRWAERPLCKRRR
ncbi:MAG: hypothetical protein D6701_02270 [Gemmatimonadetes bacterium]|nr:MAG: hypothetical protein D6701_02270 [Gemmatimonadota bacterium]